MILKLFCIYDSKVEVYTNPMCYKTRGESIRSFSDNLAKGESNYALHPEDYVLFEVGTWDCTTCTFDIYPAPVSVGKALEFMPAS